MMSVAFDLRDAVRGLRREGAYALTVVVTLALTIGGTSAVFSIVNGVLLKPLAYRESQQLVELREMWRELVRNPSLEVNEQHFEYWRQRATSFESMAQYIALPANLTGVGEAAQITVVHASSSLFDVLGLQTAAGRALATDDERTGRPAVAVITDSFWKQRFGGDPAAIGRSIALTGIPHLIVGILPAGFRLPGATRPTAVPPDVVVSIRLDDDHVGWVGDHNNAAIGRLRPGVTPERARGGARRAAAADQRPRQSRRARGGDAQQQGDAARRVGCRHGPQRTSAAPRRDRRRAAHRLLEPREPVADAHHRTAARLRRPFGARRRASPADRARAPRAAAACGRGRGARDLGRVGGADPIRENRTDRAAARQRDRARRPRA